MNPECQRHQEDILKGSISSHVHDCDDCRSFYTVERQLAPPAGLIDRALERLHPVLVARAAERRELFWRLTLAGAFSLPFILALNAGMVWMTYTALERLATPQLAMTGASLVAASLLLALSLAYGSLPLLASWGLHLREKTT